MDSVYAGAVAGSPVQQEGQPGSIHHVASRHEAMAGQLASEPCQIMLATSRPDGKGVQLGTQARHIELDPRTWPDNEHDFPHSVLTESAEGFAVPIPFTLPVSLFGLDDAAEVQTLTDVDVDQDGDVVFMFPARHPATQLSDLPNEVVLQILGYLEVCDLLATSRVS